jgi:hypothetical protein
VPAGVGGLETRRWNGTKSAFADWALLLSRAADVSVERRKRRTMTQPEPWLRGPIPGIPPLLMPVAHALVMAREDVEAAISALSADELWARPNGAAAAGFHAMHLAGSLDRLFTYARGEQLDDE